MSNKMPNFAAMMKKILMIAALLASFTVVSGENMKSDNEITRRIDKVFDAVYNNPGEPGAAVLIMQGNDTVYSRCFGVADMVTKAPVTLATNFCIASVSKQFSAVAMLQLAEQGKLSRGLYMPWKDTDDLTYHTDGQWKTVTMPLSEFIYDFDGNKITSTLQSVADFGSFNIFVIKGSYNDKSVLPTGVDCLPYIKIDNIRVVPNK